MTESDNPTIRPERTPSAPSPGELQGRLPQLEILELLGQGGMGAVYKARQSRLDRIVAVKILPPETDRDPSFAERFGREARALARLHHPNIVMVHDCGHEDGLYYLVMEHVDGTDLRRVMRAGGLDTAQALAIVGQVCDALQYAHEEGVVHRDIKPENILIDTRGRAKIADFGLVKMLGRPGTDIALTAPQQVMGTMHYMAPEQIERPAEVDRRADVYALGVVLYELLTGELPIGRFPLPSEKARVDRRLDEIVLHALEKEPDRRYQQASEIRTAIDEVSSTAHPQPLPVPSPSAPRRGSSRAAAWSGAGPVYDDARSRLGEAARFLPVRSTGIAYLFWLLCFFGLCGMHRFYAGKWVTGILWLLTGGLLFIGQLVDLFLIPGMIRLKNLENALVAQALADGPSG